jgi:hypothetical protein
MKRRMFLNALFSVLFVAHNFPSLAVDLIVQDSGPVGTYPTIDAAYLAAVDGDRILVNNQLSSAPWPVNLTIDKSITLMNAIDNQRFTVDGSIIINSGVNREVTIIGMDNSSGFWNVSVSPSVVSNRTKVNMLWCKVSGNTNFAQPNYDATIASCEFPNTSTVSFAYGKVTGCAFNGGLLQCLADVVTSDTNYIVGNTNVGRIINYNNTQSLLVSNNTVGLFTSSGNVGAIQIEDAKQAIDVTCEIKNNTVQVGQNAFGITMEHSVGSSCLVENNVIQSFSSFGGGIRKIVTAGLVEASYNFISSSASSPLSGISNNGTNVIGPFTVDLTTGTNTSPGSIDGGTPSILEYDLDLTRNDAGALGGSYTLNNFHPIGGTSAKVFFLTMSSQLTTNSVIDANAFGFDR